MALLLTRRNNETLCLGEDIELQVSGISFNSVGIIVKDRGKPTRHRLKVFENLDITPEISVAVASIKGASQARFAITAPRNVRIDRFEIRMRKNKDTGRYRSQNRPDRRPCEVNGNR